MHPPSVFSLAFLFVFRLRYSPFTHFHAHTRQASSPVSRWSAGPFQFLIPPSMKCPPLSVDSLFQEVVPNMVTLVGGLSLPLHVNRHGQPIHITGVLVLDGQAVFFRLDHRGSILWFDGDSEPVRVVEGLIQVNL